jgi:integrase/recombinase XerD
VEEPLQRYLDFLKVEKGLSKNTLAAYGTDLHAFHVFAKNRKKTSWSELTSQDVLEHVMKLSDQSLKARSLARHLIAIRGLYKFLLKEGDVKKNPTSLVELPKAGRKLPNFLSLDEVDKILSVVHGRAQEKKGPRGDAQRGDDRAPLRYGLRVSELVNLTVDDLHMERGFLKTMGRGRRRGSCRWESRRSRSSNSTWPRRARPCARDGRRRPYSSPAWERPCPPNVLETLERPRPPGGH